MSRETQKRKVAAVAAAEAAGQIADSTAVRSALVERMRAGELTHAQVMDELKRIRRSAKAAGKTTRARAWRNG